MLMGAEIDCLDKDLILEEMHKSELLLVGERTFYEAVTYYPWYHRT